MAAAAWRRQPPTLARSVAPKRETDMLVVSRRADESIQIKLADGVDTTLTLKDLFAKGPIEITLLGGNGRRVKMGIAAPPELTILRVDKPD